LTNLVDSLVEKLGLGGLPDAPVGVHEQLPSIVEGDLFVLSASATNKRNLQENKVEYREACSSTLCRLDVRQARVRLLTRHLMELR
jgi:hypothetical protein